MTKTNSYHKMDKNTTSVTTTNQLQFVIPPSTSIWSSFTQQEITATRTATKEIEVIRLVTHKRITNWSLSIKLYTTYTLFL
ncbi:unnamed protein product [Rotaria sp. Silwood2]|nr:unnamed protein product [Rotaria sp. Silwood2]